ncbi:Nn.00g060040.m01.CDS01 [Neocucurbitaria sp. VM-36]
MQTNDALHMVFNPDLARPKEPITAVSIAHLTPAQLDHVQDSFGIGATLCSPNPSEQLFIHDKREWAASSHADMKRAYPDAQPLLVIDSRTPLDGAVWYIDRFADTNDVESDQAENTDTLFKIRMTIQDVVISYVNYGLNTDIREDMDQVDIPYPTPEHFNQDAIFKTGFDCIKDRFLSPTWVTATPEELDETNDRHVLDDFMPRPDIAYRLRPGSAHLHGLKCQWTIGSAARDVELSDGTILKFPGGSKTLQLDYDPNIAAPRYERPKGSL